MPVPPATMMITTIIVGVMATVVPAMASVRIRGRHDSRDGQSQQQALPLRFYCSFCTSLRFIAPLALYSEASSGLVHQSTRGPELVAPQSAAQMRQIPRAAISLSEQFHHAVSICKFGSTSPLPGRQHRTNSEGYRHACRVHRIGSHGIRDGRKLAQGRTRSHRLQSNESKGGTTPWPAARG